MKDIERRMLEDEESNLLERLEPGALDDLDILVRSAERRAIRERLNEVQNELSDDEITREGRAMSQGGLT